MTLAKTNPQLTPLKGAFGFKSGMTVREYIRSQKRLKRVLDPTQAYIELCAKEIAYARQCTEEFEDG